MKTGTNLVGKKFGRLTVIKDITQEENSVKWLCLCDCGKETEVFGNNLRRHHTRSCGCLNIERINKAPSVSGINSAFRAYQKNAMTRNIYWGLTRDEFITLSSEVCFYCGAVPTNISRSKSKSELGDYIYNGIDRVDNSKGYTLNNCVTCCHTCNARKGGFSIIDMIKSLEFLGYKIIRADDII